MLSNRWVASSLLGCRAASSSALAPCTCHLLHEPCRRTPPAAFPIEYDYISLVLFRIGLEAAVQEAQQYVQRFQGCGWFRSWLASSTDKAQLQELDRQLRDGMQGFQVRVHSCCTFVPLLALTNRCIAML